MNTMHVLIMSVAAVAIICVFAHCNEVAYKQGYDPMSNKRFDKELAQ